MPHAPKPVIPGYQLVEKIGQGGMGTVWKAEQKTLGRYVAIKVLAEHLSADPNYIARFTREILAAARLNHPNIVRVYEASQAGGLHYFVMEYVEGRPVTRRLREMGRLPEREALQIALQVARALDYAWNTEHLVHRDIKPDNILLARDGTVKITDFGLVRRAQTDDDKELRAAGLTVGTPYYIAPEQARGEENLDCRTDLYSLGASLYHMLSGQVPFEGETNADIMAKHVSDTPASLKKLRPYLSDATVAIVEKLMAKRQEDRYQTHAELMADIERVLRHETPVALEEKLAPPAPPPPDKKPARTVVMVAALAVALVATLAAGWFWWRYDTASRHRQHSERANELESARALFKEAQAFVESHPNQFTETLQYLHHIKPSLLGTPFGTPLFQLIEEVENRRDAAAAQAFARLADEAQPLIEAGQFAKAIAIYESFPEDLKGSAVTPKIKEAQEAIRNVAREQLKQLTADFYRLVKEGKRPEAVALLNRIAAIDTPEVPNLLKILYTELNQNAPQPDDEPQRE